MTYQLFNGAIKHLHDRRIHEVVSSGIAQFVVPVPWTITPISNSQSLDFDGVDEYILADSSYKGVLGADWTVSCWLKFDVSQNELAYYCHWGKIVQGQLAEFAVQANSKLRMVCVALNIDTDATTSIFDGAWHHVAWVVPPSANTEDVICYMDGTARATTATTTGVAINITSDRDLEVAREVNHSAHADVTMDEFSLWDTALSAAEVLAIYNAGYPIDLATDAGDYASSANLQLWWRYESDSGTGAGNVKDASGNGKTGTTQNLESGDFLADAPP